MALEIPTTISVIPVPPSHGDIANFPQRADDFLLSLLPLREELNAENLVVYGNAVHAYEQALLAQAHVTTALSHSNSASTSADAANTSAIAASTSAGANMWVSGTTYGLGDAVWSPSTRLVYRRIVAGAGTTDPSIDPTNWATVGTVGLTVVIVAGTTQTALAGAHYILTNVAATTLTLPATPIESDTVWVTWENGITTNIIARNGQTIMGVAEDMSLDALPNGTVQLRFINSSWRIL